ncbi:glycosyltransferase [Butyrivibrio sp. NC2007]|uniref:glycosyltransferase n=1 Tax=Butyrivibrio sp. NC2007 TaxID=1280683 RepID=UPI0003B6076E|nr:glycosyltransferase [Butyrivibrio sp. NC2007]
MKEHVVMKIAIIISALDDGGAAAIVSQITTHLSEDFDVDIILNNSENIRFPYCGTIIDLGVKNISKDRSGVLYQLKAFIKRLAVLPRLKRANKYEACVSYLDSANVANIISNYFYRPCKTVLNVVNNMSATARAEKRYRYIVNPLIRKLYNKADCIIAQTEDIKKDLVRNYDIDKDRIYVNYSAIDIEKIKNTIAKPHKEERAFADKWLDKDKTVITAGRFVMQKGHGHLIRAFSKVVSAVDDAKLVIIGNGELESYYRQLIKDYNIENNVVLHEFTPDYTWLISRSAIFAFPSVYEGFGMALQDAMACGVACIAADYQSGARELLANGFDGAIDSIYYGENGIITPTVTEKLYGSECELDYAESCMADAILEVLSDEKRRKNYGCRACEKSKEYSLDSVTEIWEKILKRVCIEDEKNSIDSVKPKFFEGRRR